MEDMERYGDYNEYEEDQPKSANPILIILKILIALVCVSVVGLLVFRMIIFNYYPANIKNIYMTEELVAYYNEKGGELGAETQKLRAPYDDPNVANFICSNLIVVREAGVLQISVRFNDAAVIAMQEKYGLENLEPTDPKLLSFRLVDNYGNVYANLSASVTAEFIMYHYYKLSFSDIEFFDLGDGTYPEWIRLEIFVSGADSEEPYAMVPVYENNEKYHVFEAYTLSKEELPDE